MHLKVGLFMAALLALATAARADLSIVVGAHVLQPNQAGQAVPIFVTGTGAESVQGMNFRVTEGDGGAAVLGIDDAPAMTGDIVGPGTLFSANNVGVTDASFGPMILDLGTTTVPNTSDIPVPAGASLLGVIIFDTTGKQAGIVWPLLMSTGIGGDTVINPFFVGDPTFPLLIENGSVTIVPEPSSVVLGMFAVAGLGAVAIRRRRARG